MNVHELKAAYEFATQTLLTTELPSVKAEDHEITFNASTLNEFAVLMPNDPIGLRDIRLHTRSNQLQRISALHRAYETLQHPLLIPHGTNGWSLELDKQA